MDHSIFISHSSRDKQIANAICAALEARGLGCWIAHRDVGPRNFGEAIVRAIRAAKVMVLVFTGNANGSDEIKKELVLASQCRLVVIPVRVEDVVPDDAFAYEFATRQWIDLFEEWEPGLDRLTAWITDVLPRATPCDEAAPPGPLPRPAAPPCDAPMAPAAAARLAAPAARLPERPAPREPAVPRSEAPRRPGSWIPTVAAVILVIQTIFQMIDIGLNQARPAADQYPSEFLAQGAAWSTVVVLAGIGLMLRPRWARTMLTWLSAIGLGWELYLMALAARSPEAWQAHLNVYLAYPAVFAFCLALLVFDGWRRRKRRAATA